MATKGLLARWLAWCSVLLAVTFVVFLLTAQYTRKARAPAVLAYANDPVLVAATEAGYRPAHREKKEKPS